MSQAYKKMFMDSISDRPAADLLAIISDLYDEKESWHAKYTELSNSGSELVLQFQQMKTELEALRKENAELYRQNSHLTGIKESQAKDLFGRRSEEMKGMLGDIPDLGFSDPLDEDKDADEPDPGEHASDQNAGGPDLNTEDNDTVTGTKLPIPSATDEHKEKRKKEKGKREADLSGLPVQTIYEFDAGKLDEQFGAGEWRIVFWEKHDTVELVRSYSFLKRIYTPVISSGYPGELHREAYTQSLLPKSLVSQSLMADILFNKYNLFQPLYRQDENMIYGIKISRQTMSNWVLKTAGELLRPVYSMLAEMLKGYKYQQCDETTYLVIMDGRNAGSKCFIWVHRSGVFMAEKQIIIYCLEKTRGSAHLFSFYEGLESGINLTCDAYSAYDSIEKAMPDKISVSGCFMHVRRRFYYAALVLKVSAGIDPHKFNEIPEIKALLLIRKMYSEENKLSGMSAEERLKERREHIEPVYNEFMDYIESLKDSMDTFSDKMKDAVSYALNQKEKLHKFLEDGNIPIDNGASERSVKPIAQGRKNYLFSTSMKGGEATAIATSLMETAKANGADPYVYLMFVLERMSKKVYYYQDVDLSTLCPWTGEYKAYEAAYKESLLHKAAPPGNEKPETDRKSIRKDSAA
ncbi:MAG: IS66 family transposase [Lachnospiraceae bacterium]|nr:IS66 family transposase [Lachnospiraceae bacterium]